MPQKHGLGKGLDALLPDTEERTEVALAEIQPRPDQPRQQFLEKELLELAHSIRVHGVLQPLVVAASGDGYELIAGERRFRAAKLAGLSHVPVFIRAVNQQNHYELALIENLQRADLNPAEEARAYHKLMQDFGVTQDELAKRLGKSRSRIAGMLRLLRLPEPILRSLERGMISTGHASALLSHTGADQAELFSAITEGGLSVREAEQWRRKAGLVQPKQAPEWVRELERELGSQVEQRGTADRGALVLKYYSPGELNSLLSRLKRPR